ncbi:MAG: hypothetical protein MUE69_33900 [Myxococcota bacterium]|nr:hypothetical protein [Myxococcota bacterium]
MTFSTYGLAQARENAPSSHIGPFSVTLAASQTSAAMVYGVSGAAFVAPRAGKLVGLSAQLSAAITGAGTTVTAHVFVNGVAQAALDCVFTQAGAAVVARVALDKKAAAIAIAAGDLIRVVYTSTGISNTPTMVATVEVEL